MTQKYPAMQIFLSLNNSEASKLIVRLGVGYCLLGDLVF